MTEFSAQASKEPGQIRPKRSELLKIEKFMQFVHIMLNKLVDLKKGIKDHCKKIGISKQLFPQSGFVLNNLDLVLTRY